MSGFILDRCDTPEHEHCFQVRDYDHRVEIIHRHLPIPSRGKACISPSQGTDALPSGRTSRALGRVNFWELPIRLSRLPVDLAAHTERTVQALRTGSIATRHADLYMFFALDNPRHSCECPEASLASTVVGRVKMNITRIYSFWRGEKRKHVRGHRSFLPPHECRWIPRKDFHGHSVYEYPVVPGYEHVPYLKALSVMTGLSDEELERMGEEFDRKHGLIVEGE